MEMMTARAERIRSCSGSQWRCRRRRVFDRQGDVTVRCRHVKTAGTKLEISAAEAVIDAMERVPRRPHIAINKTVSRSLRQRKLRAFSR